MLSTVLVLGFTYVVHCTSAIEQQRSDWTQIQAKDATVECNLLGVTSYDILCKLKKQKRISSSQDDIEKSCAFQMIICKSLSATKKNQSKRRLAKKRDLPDSSVWADKRNSPRDEERSGGDVEGRYASLRYKKIIKKLAMLLWWLKTKSHRIKSDEAAFQTLQRQVKRRLSKQRANASLLNTEDDTNRHKLKKNGKVNAFNNLGKQLMAALSELEEEEKAEKNAKYFSFLDAVNKKMKKRDLPDSSAWAD